ncbi:MAG: hypothetical protein AAF065_03125 [Verrucomicrobiota bacterium]
MKHLSVNSCILFSLFCVLAQLQTAHSEAKPSLFLETGTWPLKNYRNEARLPLLREILRQGLIVSAEQEFGWRTYDESMGDLNPEDRSNNDLQLSFRLYEKTAFHYSISAGDTTRQIAGEIPVTDADPKLYRDVLVLADKLSRSEFIGLLKQLDLTPTHEVALEVLPGEIAVPQLEQIDFLSLWLNLRELHGLLDTYGEEPQILNQLSQAYVTLGMATYSLSSTAPRACMARGLIYAQRLLAQDPDSAESYYTRAYAWALTGFPNFALQDLASAKQFDGKSPDWLPVVQSYADYDLKKLESYMHDEGFKSQLAGMLTVFATYPINNQAKLFRVAEPAIEANSKNLQLIHLATEQGGVSSLHRLTLEGPAILNKIILDDFRAVESLYSTIENTTTQPKSLSRDLNAWDVLYSIIDEDHIESMLMDAQVEEAINFPRLYSDLRELQVSDADVKQPSTALLADLIWETRFLHIMNRLRFMRYWWGVSVGDTVTSMLLDIKGHRYEKLVEAYAETNTQKVRRVLSDMEVGEIIGTAKDWLHVFHVMDAAPEFKDLNFGKAKQSSYNTFDITALDIEPHTYAVYARKAMQRINPNSVALIKNSILKNKKIPIDQLAAKYEGQLQLSSEIPKALGKRYEDKGKLHSAKKYYQAAVDQDPNSNNLYALAQIHYELEEHEDWLKTEQSILQSPDHGLLHSYTNHRIAGGLFEQGQWEEAVRYAKEGARCGAEITLYTAGWIYGFNGDVETGLDYMISSSERYNHAYGLINYLSAFALEAPPHVSAFIENAYKENRNGYNWEKKDAAIVDLHAGKIDSAISILVQSMEESNDIWCGITAALLADSKGWKDRRNQILAKANKIYPKYRKPKSKSGYSTDKWEMAALGSMLKLYSEISLTTELSAEHRNRLIKLADANPKKQHSVDINVFAAEILFIRGEDALATQLFKQSLTKKFATRHVRFLAYQRLRELGRDPIQIISENHKPST